MKTIEIYYCSQCPHYKNVGREIRKVQGPMGGWSETLVHVEKCLLSNKDISAIEYDDTSEYANEIPKWCEL